jgi:hypothetical protein
MPWKNTWEDCPSIAQLVELKSLLFVHVVAAFRIQASAFVLQQKTEVKLLVCNQWAAMNICIAAHQKD